MLGDCLRACIAANYDTMWDKLLLAPPDNISDFQPPREPHEPEDPKLWRISRIVGRDIWREETSSRNKHFQQ